MSDKITREPAIRFDGFTDAWEQRKLGDIIISELKGKAKAEMVGTEVPYLETNYLNGGEISFVNSPANVEKDDVLILWDGSQAGTVYHGFEGALGSTLKAYKPKGSGEFLYQYLKRYQQVIYNSYRTPNIPHVVKTFTSEFQVSVPSIDEQAKIGSFFANLDHLITFHQRKCDLLGQAKKSYLQKMFPKNGADVPEIRFQGFTDTWKQRKLGDICATFVDGDWIEAKDQSNSGIRLLQTGNVGINEYLDKTDRAKWISDVTFARLKCTEVFPGDILISRLPEPAGRACIVPNTGQKMITAVDCTIVRTDENCVSDFLVQYLSSESYFKTVNNFLTGGTRKRISRGNLATLAVTLPSIEEQRQIGSFFANLDSLITLHQRELNLLKNMKKSLLQQMFA